jgi:hypothetical protein
MYLKKLFLAIIIIYIIYPLIYLFSVSPSASYLLVNAGDSIINTLWIGVGILSISIIFYTIQLKKKDLINYKKAILYGALSIFLFSIFKIYVLAITFADFMINGFRSF